MMYNLELKGMPIVKIVIGRKAKCKKRASFKDTLIHFLSSTCRESRMSSTNTKESLIWYTM